MKLTVEFDSIEEFEAFRTSGKKSRGKGKDDAESEVNTTAAQAGSAPPPLPPPVGGAMGFNPGATQGFAPPGAGAAPGAGAFPAVGAPQVAPEVQAIVNRITAKLDAAIASGQPADKALEWMQGQCGAPGATMDQIKQVSLPKLSMPQLENIAKLMGVPSV